MSRNTFRVIVGVSLLIQVKNKDNNLYKITDHIGWITQSCFNDIEVFDYETSTSKGCLALAPSSREQGIDVNNYGQIDVALKLQQATVEAQYEMLLFN
jgi:hypothetical protein